MEQELSDCLGELQVAQFVEDQEIATGDDVLPRLASFIS